MVDENKKGITVKIDADLHAQVKAYIESRGMTMAEFITAACDDLLHPKITEKEEKKMPKNLPLLKAYLGIENAPAEAGAKMELHHRVFQKVFNIAAKHT